VGNPFGSEEMAAGYATSRPPVHAHVIEHAARTMNLGRVAGRTLDVGCGSGISTAALRPHAAGCIGIDPAESMLRWGRITAPCAAFAVGTAEAIPLRNGSVECITAAGSLNYADLDLFFPEARRVLAPDGVLLVYDFGPGMAFRGERGLEDWFQQFSARYPPPYNEGRYLDPDVLKQFDSGFRVIGEETFEIGIRLTAGFYLDYMLTETNVASAIRAGVPQSEIRDWCAETLAAVWRGEDKEVLFRGYWVCLIPL
jgi:ubiquinone/menaquinone biosynthesis C-methylase UbiE